MRALVPCLSPAEGNEIAFRKTLIVPPRMSKEKGLVSSADLLCSVTKTAREMHIHFDTPKVGGGESTADSEVHANGRRACGVLFTYLLTECETFASELRSCGIPALLFLCSWSLGFFGGQWSGRSGGLESSLPRIRVSAGKTWRWGGGGPRRDR